MILETSNRHQLKTLVDFECIQDILFIQLSLMNSYLALFGNGGKDFLEAYLGPYQMSTTEVFLGK